MLRNPCGLTVFFLFPFRHLQPILGVPLNGPPPPSVTNIEDDTIKTLEVISEPVARRMYRTAIGRQMEEIMK